MRPGWRTAKLGELTTKIGSGATPRGGDESYKSEGISLIRSLNVYDDGFRQAKLARIDSEQAGGLSNVVVEPHDVLLNITGASIARCCRAPMSFLPARVNQHVSIIRPVREKLDPDFLHYLLISKTYKDRLLGAGDAGATRQAITKAQLQDFVIEFPDNVSEQQRIVRVLDEAFAALATAQANAEKNLQNARALFESHLNSIFTQPTTPVARDSAKTSSSLDLAEMKRLHPGYVTRTGGRDATTRHIPPRLSLAVGVPKSGSRKGWCWSALSDLARLESGHTPSRRHPEYWGGRIPWIEIQDARNKHGGTIESTIQTINELGTENSSARLLPAGTVCLSRTASVGYVVIMACPMATSQDFVNWVCSGSLLPDFLKYLLLAEGREGLLRFASGSVHQTIYFPEAKAFHICHPEVREQARIVRLCDELGAETQRLTQLYERKLASLDELKKSLLQQAFSGEL